MAGTARIQNFLSINSGNLVWQSPPPGAFNVVVQGAFGPTPGAMTAAVDPGTDVDLSKLHTLGGLYFITNLDLVNWVTVGIYDPSSLKFYPKDELLPGETWISRLSRHIGEQYHGTGTGVAGPTLRIVANTAPCNVVVGAFDA